MLESIFGSSSEMPSQEAMAQAKLPLGYRDNCAHLLIPLNKCRSATFSLPYKCEDERHSYEKCQYEDFKKRVKEFDAQKA
ncbi:putative NADH-ubiquinone oxidoreductase B18 subunit [Taphrina deformans PYCC 5710]|uniref:NADH dehydrogenase [ubiquinone] 1 beta subcomplex subunit 7 n=1 Tax=Taphrina deformans (strain PYCC 5710 / ATCC 11124 / CBS 356.35 / IMI 108563 / JCM 9778 / NBRC 8474) TaxID=1097556 RepID=R4X7U4_TAPDE|nr:putative NADH-ubiquinone oxidoreductase B18 subunit [Taphrina deformans PYCC 5710]|eukprot:CCG81521.1 putative NADH-ubiquinone oxidoreductase B18 subunit [Taphrina deformans PYCC 5710]